MHNKSGPRTTAWDKTFYSTVFEFKGALCTLCVHFDCRVYGFQHLCTRRVHPFFNMLTSLYKKEHKDKLPGA